MYLETGGGGFHPPPWQPPRKARITKKQERTIMWLIGVNALLLVVAPIGGVTIVEVVIKLFGW